MANLTRLTSLAAAALLASASLAFSADNNNNNNNNNTDQTNTGAIGDQPVGNGDPNNKDPKCDESQSQTMVEGQCMNADGTPVQQ
jgi:hypothetical protein